MHTWVLTCGAHRIAVTYICDVSNFPYFDWFFNVDVIGYFQSLICCPLHHWRIFIKNET